MKALILATMALFLVLPAESKPGRPNPSPAERLALAVRLNDLDKALQQLKRGADVDTRAEDGRTILMLAAAQGKVVALKKIKAKGANLDLQDNEGRTALMHASPDPGTMLFFLNAGANTALKDKQGRDFSHHFAEAMKTREEAHARGNDSRRIMLIPRDASPLLPIPGEVRDTLP